jgi:hypothetical protein
MYISTPRVHDLLSEKAHRAHTPRARAGRRTLSARAAVALYVLGIFVETFGLAVIAAYGWFALGTAVALAGVWIATTGNRAWPSPESSTNVIQRISGYLAPARAGRHRDGPTNNLGR